MAVSCPILPLGATLSGMSNAQEIAQIQGVLSMADIELEKKRSAYAAALAEKARRQAEGKPYAEDMNAVIEKRRIDVELQETACGSYGDKISRLQAEDRAERSDRINLALAIVSVVSMLASVASAFIAWKAGHP